MDLAHGGAACYAAMREYGMPERIRTDNGAPFAGGSAWSVEVVAGMDEAWPFANGFSQDTARIRLL